MKNTIFVLDTNILLHNPNVLLAFKEGHVVLPMTVLEELDKFKTNNNELGRNSREVARSLDKLRGKGSLREGVKTEHGGIIQVMLRYETIEGMLPGVNDNVIIGCAMLLKNEGKKVVFVSKDINARIKADALGIESQDYDNNKVNFDELQKGYCVISVSPDEYLEIAAKAENGDSIPIPEGKEILANEFVVFETEDEVSIIFRRFPDSEELTPIDNKVSHLFGIKPRNYEQKIAMDLLNDEDIKLLTIVGTAGTGKTLLALASGMNSVLKEKKYTKMLVSRPIMPLGQDIGYLPGGKNEKLTHWMGPIFDNLHFMLAHEEKEPDDIINKLLDDEIIALEALTYIRGRSISKHYLIVDEAQNLTPHEIKTIVSRAGENTKIILTGDPYQIDNPYLDVSSNGLTFVAEKMRGKNISAHVTLHKSERSELAGLAAEIL